MRATTFFKKIINLPNTIIDSIHLGKNGASTIRIRPRSTKPRCGQCNRKSKRLHGKKAKLRSWRHLGIWGSPVELVSKVYRILCAHCGVTTMAVPWARVGSMFSRIFEDEVAWFLQKTNQTATAQYFGISWPTAGNIAARVVSEKLDDSLLENLRFLGVDEISYGRPRKFLTVVVDHQKHRVIWAGPGQSSVTLTKFFEMVGQERLATIEAISIDMDPAFEKALRQCVPHAEIIYDRFHIVQLASKAVDEVRRQIVRSADPTEKPQVKSTRWALLKNPANLTFSEADKLSSLQKTNRKLYRAYLLKETLQTLFDTTTATQADFIFSDWFSWARRSCLEPFKQLALTLQAHYPGIRRFIEKRITNSPVEGFNSKIRMISHRAFGFHSAEALIAMIKLNCSGIHLRPVGS